MTGWCKHLESPGPDDQGLGSEGSSYSGQDGQGARLPSSPSWSKPGTQELWKHLQQSLRTRKLRLYSVQTLTTRVHPCFLDGPMIYKTHSAN